VTDGCHRRRRLGLLRMIRKADRARGIPSDTLDRRFTSYRSPSLSRWASAIRSATMLAALSSSQYKLGLPISSLRHALGTARRDRKTNRPCGDGSPSRGCAARRSAQCSLLEVRHADGRSSEMEIRSASPQESIQPRRPRTQSITAAYQTSLELRTRRSGELETKCGRHTWPSRRSASDRPRRHDRTRRGKC